LSGSAAEGDELRGYWKKLLDGGTMTVPLEAAPWGDEFGMCVDRFGIGWLVNIAGPEA
jgi:PhnB protein